MNKPTIFILAGELSGDLHGAALAHSIKRINPNIRLDGWGGDEMANAGVNIFRNLNHLAFMGFVEVAKNTKNVLANFKLIKKYFRKQRPDIIILVDYPGFNLKVAKIAFKSGIPVYYFISPTVWAWKSKRMYVIKDYVKKLYCILPFEVNFYHQHNIDNVAYLGNPLIDKVNHFKLNKGGLRNRLISGKYVAILPGSRMQEIKFIFPKQIAVMKQFPTEQFIISCAPSLSENILIHLLDKHYSGWTKHIRIHTGASYEILEHAQAAVVTSGTATLETALFTIPMIVTYITSSINYRIAKSFVKIKFISLVNLIANKEIVPEFIQDLCTVENIVTALNPLLQHSPARDKMIFELKQLQYLLGDPGVTDRIAQDLLKIENINNPDVFHE